MKIAKAMLMFGLLSLVLVPAMASADVYLMPNDSGAIVFGLADGEIEWGVYSVFDSVSLDHDDNSLVFVDGADTFTLSFVPDSDARMVVSKFDPRSSVGTLIEYTVEGVTSYFISLEGLSSDGILSIESSSAYSDRIMSTGGSFSFCEIPAVDGEVFEITRQATSTVRATIITEDKGWNKIGFDYELSSESEIVRVQWNFGDGNGSKDFSPVHQYDRAGVYIVTLILYDEFGSAGYVTEDVTVGDPDANQAEAYLDYWMNERAAGALAIVLISFLLAALYVYVADKEWGGAYRVFPIAIIALGFIIALLVYGGN